MTREELIAELREQDLCDQLNITKEELKMSDQQNLAWLEEEIKATQSGTSSNFEKLPSLKLLPNKITEITVDFSQPFAKWADKIHKQTKAIVPVTSNGTKMNFWLNVKNPLYAQICNAGKAGKTTFKILQTGSQAETKYNLVE